MSLRTSNTIRLLAAAKEFNIGKDTLVDFLNGKGFEIDGKPSTKLSEEMYDALQDEFAKDRATKKKSEAIALPKGSILENLNKSKADLEIPPNEDAAELPAIEDTPAATPQEEIIAPVIETQEVKAEEYTSTEEVIIPQVAKAAEPEIEESVKEPVEKVHEEEVVISTELEIPVVETRKEEKPGVDKIEAEKNVKQDSVEEKTTKTEEVVVPESNVEITPENRDIDNLPQVEEDDKIEHIDTKTPKLQGPKILDKINLEDLNLTTRPKKGSAPVKKELPKVEVKAKPSQPANPVTSPAKQEPKREDKKKAPQKTTTPQVIDNRPKREPTPKPQLITEVKFDQPVEIEKEHIDFKAPRLEGPKVIGKIELPVGTVGGRQERKEKRKRKRIPVDKKPEANKPGAAAAGTANTTARPATDRPAGNRPNQGNNQQGGPRRDSPRKGQHNNNDRRNPSRNPAAPNTPQEIDAKEIQEKIRQTQAKLAGGGARNRNLKARYRRNKREEMAERRAAAEMHHDETVIQVTEFISVSELANLLDVNFAEIISKCMSLGIMVSINQRLDAEVIELVASEFDREVEFINLDEKEEEEEEEVDNPQDLLPRAPVVTIMGHVDHGKTSLLDYIRNATVVAGEAGGITQHIGAYKVTTESGKEIAFLDTPGHEAFTAMRARGAKAADIAVIVVAADDAIMPQTKEAISHAQAAGLPMVFAINKIDKESANPEKIKEQLSAMNILVEDWGGTFQCQEISAKKGINIDLLLEKILLEAEMLELTANPNKAAVGSVIEASLDKGRGYVSSILVQGGTLNAGDIIVSGQYFGKIRAMFNERGQKITKAAPSTPVQILGLNGAPQAGEKFKVYTEESEAKNIANHRAQILREQGLRARKHITLDEIGRRLALGNFKELNVIIKADFDGSSEALSDSLQKLSTEEVVVNVVLKGVGQITESDVMLASASDAIILGFQVRPSIQAAKLADQENIEIRYYSIIYDAIAEIKSAMEGMLEPTIEKKIVGNIEVREVYKISSLGTIAGCYVLDGKFTRNTRINVIRDGIVVHTGELASLKRFKDDVKEVNAGYECGLSIKNFNDLQVNDNIEGYEEVEIKRKLV